MAVSREQRASSDGVVEREGIAVRTGTAHLPSTVRGRIHEAGNDGFTELVEDSDRCVPVHGDPQVTIQYVDGCPNRAVARDRVGIALARRGIDPSAVTFQLLETADDAERLGFRGSPTILIDGEDPFARTDTPVGLTCRRYRTGDTVEGAPSVAQIDAALRRQARGGARGA